MTGQRRTQVMAMASGVSWLRGLPGPVWTMALWCAIFLVATVEAIVHGHEGLAGRSWLVVVPVVVIVVVLAWGPRTPNWFLHVSVVGLLAVSFLAQVDTDVPVEVLATASSMIAAVIYSGLWWHGWTTYAYAAAASGATLVAIAVNDMAPVLLDAWFTVTAMMFGVGFALNLVVARGVHQSTHDPLTGWLNRAGLEQFLQVAGTAGRTTLPRSLVSIDLDGFKAINDTAGHAAGDRVLHDTAQAWRSVIRPDDIAVRMGGDEFLLVLPQTSVAAVDALIARMRAATATRWSCGVVAWPAEESFDHALARADALMYQNKHRRGTATDLLGGVPDL